MSVIVARALPDARDGLKPVQRRILYAMHDMGLGQASTYKKSARIVGEVLGKYHPHGDMTVYEAMARLAQDFTMRYPLVDGQGNFGSVDGDPPAAMRYTEARLASFAGELLSQIDRDTVDLVRNFDDTLNEPKVLPAAVPNLLVNGASGIAVGMATSIPPHNLGEVIDALIYMLHRWEKLDDVPVSELMQFIKGPDFPTGGIILEDKSLESLQTTYATGKGKFVLRGKVDLEDMGRGRQRLIITELPYLVNKSSLIERIAELVRESHIEGLSDLRDESDRQGMRIVIELKQGADSEKAIRTLYQRTSLQTTIGMNLLALVGDEPRLLTLKQALRVYLEHRQEVIKRRSEYDLAKAKARAHILEGMRIAISNLDEVIKLIRNSIDTDQAREKLRKKFKLSELQANAILDMQLKRLAALERKKLETEFKELLETIKYLEGVLKSARKIRLVIEEELIKIKEDYQDHRRTQIVTLKKGEKATDLLTTSDLVVAQDVWISVTSDGRIIRSENEAMPKYKARQYPAQLFKTNTQHILYILTRTGHACATTVHSIPVGKDISEATQINRILPFSEGDKLIDILSLPVKMEERLEKYLVCVTKLGMIKKSLMEELPGPSAHLFNLVKLNEGDELLDAFFTSGENSILLITRMGMGIRFIEDEVRSMGLVAAGVNAIKLSEADEIIGSGAISPEDELLLLGTDGKGWHLPAAEFPIQGRYGRGVTACKLNSGAHLVGALIGNKQVIGFALFESGKTQTVLLKDILLGKRSHIGKMLLETKPGDNLIYLVPIKGEGLNPGKKKRTTPAKKKSRSKAK
jgi:DNA gyrase subunit A